ncbi:uncharacterized protein [Apostichopus japonicus]|uniref:uncharacterized protein n=1 Tax=Stichopus japonicus TaxID=307972 RepID=UPI003AB2CCA6
MEDKHWTEQLFPPTFHLSKEEVKNPSSRQNTLKDKSPKTRVAAIYRRVKKEFDEEVWNARQKSTQVGDSLLKSSGLRGSQDGVNREDAARAEIVEKDTNLDNANLWDSSEIEILRIVFLETKQENDNLKVELDVVRNEIERTTERLKAKEKDSESKEETAKGTRNAFESLYLENTHLQREMKLMKRRCKSLEEDLKDLRTDKVELESEKRKERRKYLEEQAQRRNVEASLRNLELRTKTSERATVETLKMDYELKIKRLLDELREKSYSLEKEKEDHKNTKKALDHMRYHFASLPREPVHLASKSDDDILSNLQIF